MRRPLTSGGKRMIGGVSRPWSRLLGPVAGTGRRFGLGVDSTSRLGSLDTSEWYVRVARPRRNEARRQNEPRPA